MNSRFLALAAVALLLAPLCKPADAAPPAPRLTMSAPRYTVTDLGTLPGGHESAAYALNDRGQVVGWSDGGPNGSLLGSYRDMVHSHAVLWDGGKARDLGLLKGFPFSAGHGISNHGQVVGGWDVNYHPYIGGMPAGLLQNFVWRDGRKTILDNGTPPYLRDANAINDSGQVAGTANDKGLIASLVRTGDRAVLWTEAKTTILPVPAGCTETFATALNNTGMVAGTAVLKNGNLHAVLWRGGGVIDLCLIPPDIYCVATGVNDLGSVIGCGGGRAYLLRDGRREALEPLNRGYLNMVPRGINNQGQIAGEAGSPPFRTHAFLWQNGTTHDLNGLIPADSGWILQAARAINSHGQIVGWGSHTGKKHAFLLTPVSR